MSGSDSPTFFHGQPWSSWIEKIGRDKPLSDEEPDTEPTSSVMRLSVDDIDLYGFCPERDTFYGVVCEICNSIVKPQALIQHMESRHPSGNPSLPPPANSTSTKPAIKTPYCKLSKLKKSQSSAQLPITNNSNSKTSNSHTPVKQRTGEQQPNLLTSASPRSPLDSQPIPSIQSSGSFANAISGNSSTSPVKSPGNQPKRKRLKTERSLLKDREYDPDRHCGVWIEDTGKPCTRSLTCKAHTVSLRRTVAGRSKSFDKLLAEHRAANAPQNARTPAKVAPGANSSTSAATATTATVTATVGIAASAPDISTANALIQAMPAIASASTAELETPSSPPVLSLPDGCSYTVPAQAVDLLYRCLGSHGSNKPTKLEEDFANELESNRRIEPSMVNNNSTIVISTGGPNANKTNNSSAMSSTSVLPSLSPIQTGSISPQQSLLQYSRNVGSASPMNIEQIISKQSPASVPVVPATLPVNNQLSSPSGTVLEAKTAPMDIENSQNITMYTSPVYKDGSKSQVAVQLSRSNIMSQSPNSRNCINLFESQLDHHMSPDVARSSTHNMSNGKRLSNHHQSSFQIGRTKHEFTQDYSSAVQLESTTATTSLTNFNDISWSNYHPEPLAVSRWLRINSSRKQYNFNIH